MHDITRRKIILAGPQLAVVAGLAGLATPGLAGAATAATAGTGALGSQQDRPATIRIGVAQPAIGNPPGFYGSAFSITQARGDIEQEFARDGTKVEWVFFKGAGPAVNEALATGQLDFATQGDLPSIVARSAGLKTRLILATGIRSNIYLAVPPDSPIRRIEDLRGKRVAIFKGTNSQLPINRLLEAHGLAEKDLRALNLDTASGKAALATKDIDALFGGLDLITLREQNTARIVYSSKNDSPIFTRQSHVLVTDGFARQYPDTTARVVKAAVRTARWASDDRNRDEVFRYWARTGFPLPVWQEDYAGEPLRVRFNPQFDPFLVARYKDAVEQAYKFKLTRAKFDVDPWIDRRFLDAALSELQLTTYWPVFQANGKIDGA
ncbi:MAG: ABC transporter substrate-binding protein [Pseudomonadota bacterium]